MGTVVIFCSITWIIASPLVIFHYRKLYLTVSRELEELSQKKTVTADIKPATNDISEKMRPTKKSTAEDTPISHAAQQPRTAHQNSLHVAI